MYIQTNFIPQLIQFDFEKLLRNYTKCTTT